MADATTSRRKSFIDHIEESLIAIILGLMTMVTFANVIARYVFQTNILWALETTVFLFAWLVLLGAAYCVKVNAHLGVDVVVAALPKGLRKVFGLLAVAASITYAAILVKGSWDYWLPFIGERAWYEVDDIYMPDFLQFLAPYLNEGERWEKLPRFIPYFVLPLATTLLVFRLAEAGWRIATDQQTMIIASHEAEEMLEDLAAGADIDGSAPNASANSKAEIRQT